MRIPPVGSAEWAQLVAMARARGHGGAPVGSRPSGRASRLDELVPVVPSETVDQVMEAHGAPPPSGAPVNWKPATTTDPILRVNWGPNMLETVRWGGNVELVRAVNDLAPKQTGDIFRAEGPYPLIWFPFFVCTNRNAGNPTPPGVVIELTVGIGDGTGTALINLGAGGFTPAFGAPFPAKWIQARARSVQPLDPAGDDYTVFGGVGLIF